MVEDSGRDRFVVKPLFRLVGVLYQSIGQLNEKLVLCEFHIELKPAGGYQATYLPQNLIACALFFRYNHMNSISKGATSCPGKERLHHSQDNRDQFETMTRLIDYDLPKLDGDPKRDFDPTPGVVVEASLMRTTRKRQTFQGNSLEGSLVVAQEEHNYPAF
jgi:hypothetical protein